MNSFFRPTGTELRSFKTLEISPDPLQFLINDLPWIVVALSGLIYGSLCDGFLKDVLLVCSLLLVFRLMYRFLYLRCSQFILSTELLVYQRGVVQRDVDYVELSRVVDYREKRTLMQQLFGLKTIFIYSQDRTTPVIRIPGVCVETDIISHIRERVEYNKRRKGIYEITNR